MNFIDLHCDTISQLLQKKRFGESASLRSCSLQVNLERMYQSGYLLQNFAVFVDLGAADDPLAEALQMIRLFYEEMEQNADLIRPVTAYAEIEQNQRDGRMSALLTLEEGGIFCGDPDNLAELYHLGARMATITWNYENELGYPNFHEENGELVIDLTRGLKERGIEMLREMERLGMIIDVSHLSDAGFYDVLKHTKKPFVASHSNARSLCDFPRNLTDPMIHALADRGGIAGLNFCRDFLGTPETGQDYLDQCVRQVKYLMNLGGENFPALGSDLDGIPLYADIPDCRVMPVLADRMQKAGLTYSQIEKICWKNALRLYRELL